tara:strand:- start:123064 stop:124968 length:1905 start_codon:yes stop_codon:yes gene_type:complete
MVRARVQSETVLRCLSLVSVMLCFTLLLASTQRAQAQEAAALPQKPAQPVPDTVQSLRYGVTLFHFFQQDYFTALTELMVAQDLQALGPHEHYGDLLRAGMNLSYGMDRVAEPVFAALLDASESNVDKDQVWFYLARIAWQRGDLVGTDRAMEHMSPAYEGELKQESSYLGASLALRQNDWQGALAFASQLEDSTAWRAYYHYNLGAYQATAGNWRSAANWFDQVTAQAAIDDEEKALRDKAYSAAGYAHMAAGDYAAAADSFRGVRLDSPLADSALLGYGWARAEQDDYLSALSPWRALANKSPASQSVRESLLAVPYAYEQLGRSSLALQAYQQASAQYEKELQHLRAAITLFREGELAELLQPGQEQAQDWLSGEALLPQGEHIPYLRQLVTRHPFQVALRELRDLYSMSGRLNDARHRLNVLSAADTEQQQLWSQVIEEDRESALQERHARIRSRHEALSQRLLAAERDGDARLVADDEQSARWARLENAERLAAAITLSARQKQDMALYRGLLIWDDSEAYPARIWQLKREQRELATLLQDTQSGEEQLQQTIARRDRSSFAPRITALEQRVVSGSQRVELAINDAQGQLRQVAVAELERQAAQLARSLGQSRLAVARLYDKGSPEVPR